MGPDPDAPVVKPQVRQIPPGETRIDFDNLQREVGIESTPDQLGFKKSRLNTCQRELRAILIRRLPSNSTCGCEFSTSLS